MLMLLRRLVPRVWLGCLRVHVLLLGLLGARLHAPVELSTSEARIGGGLFMS